MQSTTKNTISTQHRKQNQVGLGLEKKIATYTAAASAAGVSLLALSQGGEAKVVYTPVGITMGLNTNVYVDFNHDGITDVIIGYFYQVYGIGLYAYPAAGNSIRPKTNFPATAAPLFFGVPIGPGGPFKYYDQFNMAYFGFKHSTGGIGAWFNIGTRCVGVRFKSVTGLPYYGWIKVNVVGIKPTVIGYAYESTPGTAITACAPGPSGIGGVDPTKLLAPESQPASLGLLARGADTIAIWRREQDLLENISAS